MSFETETMKSHPGRPVLRELYALKPIRFIAVGAFNTLFGYGLYLALLWTGMGYLLAYCLSVIIMLMVGFVLTGHIVFGQLKAARFFLYVLCWALILFINGALLTWLVAAHVPEEIAPLVLLPFSAVASYTIQKTVVFRPDERTS